MSVNMLITPQEIAIHLAKRAQKKRLSLNLSQKSLAERSGVGLGSLKQFEQQGKISLESILKIALVLDSLTEFIPLFKDITTEEPRSLEELIQINTRQRGRK